MLIQKMHFFTYIQRFWVLFISNPILKKDEFIAIFLNIPKLIYIISWPTGGNPNTLIPLTLL